MQYHPKNRWRNGNHQPRPHTPTGHEWLTTPNRHAAGSARAATRDIGEHAVSAECLHELFEVQATERPHAEAVRDEHGYLSYAELDTRANQVAHLLISHGVKSGSLVGICFERSIDAIVSILGILKAGGAYVPLDPDYPADCLAQMLADSQAAYVVTRKRHTAQLASASCQVLCLDALPRPLAKFSGSKPAVAVGPRDPAYVIYTSGSTGQPKAVVIEHRHVVYSTLCRLSYYRDPVERFALLPSLAFDSSVGSIFWALSAGGTLCLPPPGAEKNLPQLGKWVEANRITHWLGVPSLYRLLLERPTGELRSLRVVALGGDLVTPTLVKAHQLRLPWAQLFNEYGPTEAAVWSTVQPCHDLYAKEIVPIGRPIPGAQVHVLNERLLPVTPGEAGELCIGGPGVARGYLRRRTLTAERFVQDPSTHDSEARIYRSGDLVRQLPDGSLEFLGRIDNQIKIRGHRVELGHVEAAVRSLDGVVQVGVTVAKRGAHELLIAYVEMRRGLRVDSTRMRKELAERLPDYMVPAQYVQLTTMPTTARGKLDREALRQLKCDEIEPAVPPVPPDGVGEHQILRIWETLFARSPLGVCDDFFELGGDSLVAAALFARIEAEFGQSLSPETLLEHPTVRRLAAHLRTSMDETPTSAPVQICAGPDSLPLFCLPGIGGHVLEFRHLAARLQQPRPVYGLRPAGLEDGQTPHDSIPTMAAYAIRQMRGVQPHGPYALVGYSLGGNVAFEMARQLESAGEKVSLLAMLDSRLWSPNIRLSVWQRLRLHWQKLYHSSFSGRWHYLRERGRLLAARLRRLRWSPAEDDVVLGLALSESSRKVARQHWRAWRAYEPQAYGGEVLLFVALQSPELAAPENTVDRDLGWSRWTGEQLQVCPVNATHTDLLRPESVKVLAPAIEAQLVGVEERSSQRATSTQPSL